MHRLGADGYYLLHNHPSGDPLPSEGDQSVTALFESNVRGFRGHVIIDSNRYGFIRPFSNAEIHGARALVPKNLNPGNIRRLTAEILGAWRKPEVRPLETDDRLLQPAVEHELLGRNAKTSSEIAALGQAMKDRKGVTIFYLSERKIRAIETVSEKLYLNAKELANHVRGRARAYGGMKVVAYSELSRPLVEAGRKLIAMRVLHNAVTGDVGLRDIYGEPAEFEGRAIGRRVEDSDTRRIDYRNTRNRRKNAQATDTSAFEGPEGSLELSLSGMRRQIVPSHRMADEGHRATDAAQRMLDRAYDAAVGSGKYSGVDAFIGGTGSGKSVTSEATPLSVERRANRIILESHAENAENLAKRIDKAREAGLPVDVHVVIRDPVDSFRSVVGRYNRAEAKEPGSGKAVPVNYGAATHEAVIENTPKLMKWFGDDPLVRWRFIDNRGLPVEAEEVSADEGPWLLGLIDTAGLRSKFNEVLDNAKLTKRDRERFGEQSLPSEFGSGPAEESGVASTPARAAGYGERNIVFTKERLARAQEAVRRKLNPNRLNAGIDPTLLPNLLTIAGYHLEAGSIKFGDWSVKMVEHLGDWVVPHLPELYDRALQNLYWRSRRPGLAPEVAENLRNVLANATSDSDKASENSGISSYREQSAASHPDDVAARIVGKSAAESLTSRGEDADESIIPPGTNESVQDSANEGTQLGQSPADAPQGAPKRPVGDILAEISTRKRYAPTVSGRHHLGPRALGNDIPYGHTSLTLLSGERHAILQGELNAHLRRVTKKLVGGEVVDMMPRRGNAGVAVRRNFTPSERIDALDAFYRNFAEGRYYTAFRMELNAALSRGSYQ